VGAGDLRAKAGLQLSKFKDIEVGQNGLGHRIEGTGFLMDFGIAGEAGQNIDANTVQGVTKLDGDPEGSRLGRHGKRGEYRG